MDHSFRSNFNFDSFISSGNFNTLPQNFMDAFTEFTGSSFSNRVLDSKTIHDQPFHTLPYGTWILQF